MLPWILPLLWVTFVEIVCRRVYLIRKDDSLTDYELRAIKKKVLSKYKSRDDVLYGNDLRFGRDRELVWFYGVVPFLFAQDYPPGSEQTLREMMEMFNNKTCIRFRDYEEKRDREYLLIENNGTEFCYTKPGRPTAREDHVSIANFPDLCVFDPPMAMHELMHVLGFPDEQQYPGRDTWVTIYWDNVKPEAKRHYLQLNRPNVTDYAMPYDYHSVMHLSDERYSVNVEQPTIKAKIFGVLVGSPYNNLSFQDVDKINTLYDWECTIREYKEWYWGTTL
ncbi:high choriolytic enzyme 1-like [Nasonia vitripennis]|uniref:Metalloendopeptidase n=1 Tax=Nasonia vitripennis TaxID=7425 RepID=A0A7M7HGH3_NASVI|nr:high choriolytic enzyme 1-like [Nasonia vitripennis]